MTSFGKGGVQRRDFIGLPLVNQRRKGGWSGFRPLSQMNQALLDKWSWRLAEASDSLWKRVMVAKYGVAREGWDIQDPNYCSSRLWKGIIAGK